MKNNSECPTLPDEPRLHARVNRIRTIDAIAIERTAQANPQPASSDGDADDVATTIQPDSLGTTLARRVMPPSMRRLVRDIHRGHVLRRALAEFERNPTLWSEPPENVVSDLIYGWGNESWSAMHEYLIRCIQEANCCNGDILECGSGLTTLVTGIVAKHRAIRVWSLEHDEFWARMIARHLQSRGIDSVSLSFNPLRNYGEYWWYQPPLNEMPESFSLVICDGPPGNTPGGRFGLVPIMRARLSPGCILLLDDGLRQAEHAAADRWAEELRTNYRLCGSTKPYIELTVPLFAPRYTTM